MIDSRRGLSDVLGFILAFSVIVTSVAVVYVGGFGAINELAATEKAQNAEHAMSIVANGVEAIRTDTAPVRASSLNLRGGRLAVNESPTVRVGIAGTGYAEVLAVGRLRYTSDRGTVAFENGAVLSNRGAWSVREGPALTCGPDVARVPVVQVRGTVDTGGETVVRIVSRQRDRAILYPPNASGAAGPVTVTFRPPNATAGAWGDWLQREGWTDADGDGTYRCAGVSSAYVTRTTVTMTVVG